MKPTYVATLAWAFVTESTSPGGVQSDLGGAYVHGTVVEPSLAAGTPCISVALVDAVSGTFMMGSDYCGPQPTG